MSVKALRASPCIAAPLQSRGEFQQRLWMGLIHPSEACFSDMSRARGWIHIHSPEGIPEQLQKSFPRLYQQWYTILAQHKEITCYLYSRVSSHKAVVTTQQKFPHWHAGILLTPKCTTEPLHCSCQQLFHSWHHPLWDTQVRAQGRGWVEGHRTKL